MPPTPSWTLTPLAPNGPSLAADRDALLRGLNDVINALTGRTVTPITIAGQFKYTYGTPGASKVLTSDASGNATWEAAGTPGSHVLATTAGLGGQHTTSGLTAGQVLRASGATAAAFATLGHSETGTLSADDHAQYALLAGRSGGQTIIGSTAASENLTLKSTSDATKGKIIFGNASNSAYDEVNERMGIGTSAPGTGLQVNNAGAAATGISKYHALFQDTTAMAQDVGAAVVLGGKYNAGGDLAGFAAVKGHKEDGNENTAGALVLYTRPAGGSLTEGLRISSAGVVSLAVALADGQIASAAAWNAKQPAGNYITALTGEVTAAGPGSAGATVAATHSGSAHHSAASVGGAPLTLSGQQITFNYDAAHFQLSGNNLQVKPGNWVLQAGYAGGQTVYGDTAASGTLTLSSTAHATKGKIYIGTLVHDEVNNRLGIGSSSPVTSLDINDPGASVSGITVHTVVASTEAFTGTAGLGGTLALGGRYINGGASIANFAAVKGIKENTNDNDYAGALVAYTRANGGNLTERLRIASDGKVYLGNQLTSYLSGNAFGLGVNKAPATIIDATGAIADWGYSLVNTDVAGSGLIVTVPTATSSYHILGLVANSAYKFRVLGNGYTGIGVSPNRLFHIWGGDAGTDPAWLTNDLMLIEHDDTAVLQFFTPANKMGMIEFSDPDARAMGTVAYNHADDSLFFRTNGNNTRLMITSDGKTEGYYAAAQGAQAMGLYNVSTTVGVLGFTGRLGRGLTIVVAASDATDAEKAGADYICDGTADDVEIQAAIDALYATTYGGTVQLTSGHFQTTSTILVRVSTGATVTKAVHLKGAGRGSTVITTSAAGMAGSRMVQLGTGTTSPDEQHSYISVRDLSIDATVAKTSGSGIAVLNCWKCFIQNVDISHQYYGIGFDNGSGGGCTCRDVSIYNTIATNGVAVYISGGGDGFHLDNVQADNGSDIYAGVQLVNCAGVYIYHSDFIHVDYGLLINPAAGQTVTNVFVHRTNLDVGSVNNVLIQPSVSGQVEKVFLNDVWLSTSSGFGVSATAATGTYIRDLHITACHFIGCGQGIYLNGTDANSMWRVQIANNIFKELGGGGRGIDLNDRCEWVQILGNLLYRSSGSTTAQGIRVEASSSGYTTQITIADNYIAATSGTTNFTGLYIGSNATNVLHHGNTFANCNTDISGQGTAPANYMSSPVYLQPSDATNEGGEMHFVGAGSYTSKLYFDRYQNDLRLISGGGSAENKLLAVTYTGDPNTTTYAPTLELWGKHNTDEAAYFASIGFYHGTTNVAAIVARRTADAADDAGYLSFSTRLTSGSLTTALTLNQNGYLYPGSQTSHYVSGGASGIGVDIATPLTALHVEGTIMSRATTPVLALYTDATGSSEDGFDFISGTALSIRRLAAGSATTVISVNSSGNTTIGGTLTVSGDQSGAADHVFDAYDDIALLHDWRAGRPLPFETGDVLNRDRLLRDTILGLETRIAELEAKLN